MSDDSFEELEQRYRNLPDKVREVISSPTVVEQVETMGTRYGLSESQMDQVISEMGRVLLGMQTPDLFSSHIAAQTNLPKDQAVELSEEIEHDILAPVLPYLQQRSPQSTQSATQPTSLVDHIAAYEERKKRKQEEERVEHNASAEIPSNLPVGPKDVAEQYEKEQEQPKTRPNGPDPYHEPIE